jgi:hypothetical protein
MSPVAAALGELLAAHRTLIDNMSESEYRAYKARRKAAFEASQCSG